MVTEITWQELEKHNKPTDAWIGIHGKVYDITNWMTAHPGGSEFLEMAAGRECTELFESFHKLATEKLLGTAKVPVVGDLVSTKYPLYIGKSKFYRDLRTKVEQQFKNKNISDVREINTWVLGNTIFIFGGWIVFTYLSMYTSYSLLACFLFAVLAGVFHELSMVHILHDISHGAYGSSPLVWKLLGYFGEITSGHSMYVWTHRHVFAHHYYTNVCGVDPDIGIYKCSPKKPYDGLSYRGKVIILPSWYQPFLYFYIVFQMQVDDFISYNRGAMENTILNDTGLVRTLQFYVAKFLHLFFKLFLPIYLGQGILSSLFLFIVTGATAGYLFGIFSQITHVNEEIEWPSDKPIPEDWASLQVKTAVDYSADSFFWTYMSGYLNYQVVHHLFPTVAPHYYPMILPVVREVCKEHGIKHVIYDSVWECIARHFNHLKTFQTYRQRYYDRLQTGKTEKSTMLIDRIDAWFKGTSNEQKKEK